MNRSFCYSGKIQHETQGQRSTVDLLREKLNARFKNVMAESDSQEDHLEVENQNYIELDSSCNYGDIEILQESRSGTSENDYEIISIEDSTEPSVSPQSNDDRNTRSGYVSNDYSDEHNIRNNQATFKSFSAKGNLRGKKPYVRNNKNDFQTPNKFNVDEKNEWGNKDFYAYQEEILNSFLLFPIAADKLNEAIFRNNTDVAELKKGLCSKWVQTESCNSENCPWSHEPRLLFEKKFHSFPSTELINLILSMQEDQFYLDALVEGFEVLIRRDVPEKWIRIIIFYIFSKTEALYFNFIPFWCKMAEYFSTKKKIKDKILGFIELLNLFVHVKFEDRWRVFRFIEMFKSSFSDVRITYRVLKPILDFDISSKILIEAVESCNETKVDIQEVWKDIIPKINMQYIPLNGLETLLRYAETLSSSYSNILANNLKTSLAPKILSLPPNIDENEYPLTVEYLRTLSGTSDEEDKIIYKNLISNILHELTAKFDFKYFTLKINEIDEKFVERASEEIIKAIFSMELPPQDNIDLLGTTIFSAETKSAKEISASMALTMIYNYVEKKDWKTAGSILEMCDSKNISLLRSKIVVSDSKNAVVERKLIFLLAEIYLNNKKWEEFIMLLETNNIFSPCQFNWAVVQTNDCKKLKTQIVEKFFKMTLSKDMVDIPYSLFCKIRKSQKELAWPIDLRPVVNDIIVGLINKKNKEVFNLSKDVWQVSLKPTVVRSLLIFMVQENLTEEAGKFFVEIANKIYNFPKDMVPDLDSIYKINIESTWSEEELFLFFNHFFYKLMRANFNPSTIASTSPSSVKVNISIQVSTLNHDLEITPWSLMEIDNSEDAIKNRVQTVLEKKMVPPLKTFSLSKVIFIEAESLYEHLQNLFSNFKRF